VKPHDAHSCRCPLHLRLVASREACYRRLAEAIILPDVPPGGLSFMDALARRKQQQRLGLLRKAA
jgi:hypothetical protein